MISRRSFLAYTGGTTLGLFACNTLGIREAIAQVPGGTLDPAAIPKFTTPLLIPPQMPRAGVLFDRGGLIDYYEISLLQFQQQILPAGMPPTTVWGYGPARALSPLAPRIHNAPSLTIEANWNRPVRVKWINDLKDAAGRYLPHLLPVDPTLHWANPRGGLAGRDSRPTFTATPDRYVGPVPLVTHVHGAAGVADDSDGYAEAWFLPAATNIPGDYARVGTWYDFFAAKARRSYGVQWSAGSATFQYPNSNRASTLWYHDHTLGMTRLNVYAGPAGFYIIRGGPDGDARLVDTRTRERARLPGPAPSEIDQIVPGRKFHEIPIAIQDRSFNADGSLFYPPSREFFDGIVRPYIGAGGEFSPIWNPEFFGNALMVNGNTWPFLEVERRRYRFRFLNGCQSRFLILDFSRIPGCEVWQIGNEGGFLAAPVNITANQDSRLLLGLAERADVIVDFTNVPVGSYVLGNVGPDEPFGGGIPDADFAASDPATTGQVMEFRVGPRDGADTSTPPRFLRLPQIVPLPAATTVRRLALIEQGGVGQDANGADVEGPVAAGLGDVDGDGFPRGALWMDPPTETPARGATEIWEIYNTTADAHPMHIHEVAFEVVNREGLLLDGAGEVALPVTLDGNVMAPAATESGFKDTVIAYPGQVTRLRAQFDTPGQFVWHCHIVEHEDNEMMRPIRVGPEQPGQPGS